MSKGKIELSKECSSCYFYTEEYIETHPGVRVMTGKGKCNKGMSRKNEDLPFIMAKTNKNEIGHVKSYDVCSEYYFNVEVDYQKYRPSFTFKMNQIVQLMGLPEEEIQKCLDGVERVFHIEVSDEVPVGKQTYLYDLEGILENLRLHNQRGAVQTAEWFIKRNLDKYDRMVGHLTKVKVSM